MAKKIRTTAEIISEFSDGIEELLVKTQKAFDKRIIKGYHSYRYRSKREIIISNCELLNEVIRNYRGVMGITEVSDDVLKYCISLFGLGPDQAPRSLKLQYLTVRQIGVRIEREGDFNVKLNNEKFVDLIDIDPAHEALFKKIHTAIASQPEHPNARPDSGYFQYWNASKEAFEFTTEHDERLLEQFTVYATTDEIAEIISLEMFCQGLSNLKTKGYSFEELPEIDHHIISKIKIDRNWKGDELGISIDLDKLNNPDGKSADINGVNQDPKGGLIIRMIRKLGIKSGPGEDQSQETNESYGV